MTIEATFWNPSRPDRAYPGRVKTKHGAPTLWLDSPGDDAEVIRLFDRQPVIYGNTPTGQRLTLWHTAPESNLLLLHSSDDRDDNLWKQMYAYLIEGSHLQDPGGPLFRQSTATYEHLFYWATHPEEIPHDQPTPPAFDTAVLENVYGLGVDAHVAIEDPPVLEHFPTKARRFSRFAGHDVRISFTFDEPQPLSVHQRLAFNLRDLLTVSLQRSATPLRQTVSLEPSSADLPYSYYQVAKKRGGQLHIRAMAIRPSQLDPTVLFPRWWRATEELYPLTQILAGRHYTKRAYIEGHVLAAVASAERLYAQLEMPPTRFQKTFFRTRSRDIRDAERKRQPASPEQDEFVQFLGEVMKNHPTFESKLRAVADYATAEQIRAADIDIDLWIKKTKDVRNKLAHQGSHVDSLTGDDDQDWLGRVDNSTRVILTLALRRWLGAPALPPEDVRLVFSGRGTQHEPEGAPRTA